MAWNVRDIPEGLIILGRSYVEISGRTTPSTTSSRSSTIRPPQSLPCGARRAIAAAQRPVPRRWARNRERVTVRRRGAGAAGPAQRGPAAARRWRRGGGRVRRCNWGRTRWGRTPSPRLGAQGGLGRRAVCGWRQRCRARGGPQGGSEERLHPGQRCVHPPVNRLRLRNPKGFAFDRQNNSRKKTTLPPFHWPGRHSAGYFRICQLTRSVESRIIIAGDSNYNMDVCIFQPNETNTPIFACSCDGCTMRWSGSVRLCSARWQCLSRSFQC
jgi:hypothetical protein